MIWSITVLSRLVGLPPLTNGLFGPSTKASERLELVVPAVALHDHRVRDGQDRQVLFSLGGADGDPCVVVAPHHLHLVVQPLPVRGFPRLGIDTCHRSPIQ